MYDRSKITMRMKALRKNQNMTQEQVADKANISLDHYGNIERNVCGFTLSTLIAISKALGTTLSYLMFGKQSQNDDEIHRLIKTFSIENSYKAELIIENYIKLIQQK